MAGYLTTHVLDTARGRPAAGMRITLYALDGERRQLREVITNADGLTDGPFVPEAEFRTGRYELVFLVGAWLDIDEDAPARPLRRLAPVRCAEHPAHDRIAADGRERDRQECEHRPQKTGDPRGKDGRGDEAHDDENSRDHERRRAEPP